MCSNHGVGALPAGNERGAEEPAAPAAPAETVELVPLAEVDAVVKLAALLDPRLLAAPLPTEYKFRMKEVRVKRARPAKDLTLQCKLDVSECWMAYVPGCFVQPWGYCRALMVRLDTPARAPARAPPNDDPGTR
jgi:hypothetical protein